MKPISSTLKLNSKGIEVANLQEALLFFVENGIVKDTGDTPQVAKLVRRMQQEIPESTYGTATSGLVRIFQMLHQLDESVFGTVEEKTARLMNGILREHGVLDANASEKKYSVNGRVINSNGVPMPDYTVEAFIITLGKELSVGKTVSGKIGDYVISYQSHAGTNPDIQVKVYGKENQVIAKSIIKYNASTTEKIDVVVNATAEKRESEFESIQNELTPHLDGMRLKDLVENKEMRHITYLANKTGWDSRITAMFVTAHRLGDKLKLDPAHVYALLRAGIPATEDDIQSASSDDVRATIGHAIEKNIIPGGTDVERTIKTLESLSVKHLLQMKAPLSVSPIKDFLSIRLDANQQKVFAQTQKHVGNNNSKLWTELADKGFKPETISQLQLDGKLAFLTGQNAPVVKKIYEKFNIKSDVELVAGGLYKASSWKPIIGPDIPEGLTADEYATHMAGHIKQSYPTAVTAEMIRNNEVQLDAAQKDELVNFFYANESKKVIGYQPVKTWEGFDNLTKEGQFEAKKLERIYQITPSDESFTALSKTGITSSYEIARFTKKEFIDQHGKSFPNLREAEKTYDKASEVYSGALGIATTYLTTRTLPNIYSLSGTQQKEQNEIVANPTLEELLGNMDYCDCDHCKSVLSPAAYLVELLQFIDLADVPHKKTNPIDTLTSRRPDIENIQLSCENTNMAVPYIDLVNEILEYYIVNGNLTNLKDHDVTEGISQTELLAEPQFVNETAYDILKTKVFPYNLPFHQPLETLRRLFQLWDVTLEQMLSIFSTPLESRLENLSLNQDEYKTLTSIPFKKLPEYFGEPINNTITQLNAAIADGKSFSRRLGITYEDLVALLNCKFINPGITLVPAFQKLQVSLIDLQKFYAGTLTDAQLDAMIPLEIDAGAYGDDIKQWLRDNEQLIMGLITLTDIGPEMVECDFAKVELRFARPDNTTNRLDALAYHKLHRFMRLLHKTGWSIELLDEVISILLPVPSEQLTEANLDANFIRLINRISNFKKAATLLTFSEKKYSQLLLVLNQSITAEARLAQLAKILKLSIAEVTELQVLSAIDPLADDMEADQPSLMKFILTSQLLKANGLKIADLAFILHHLDFTGKLTQSEASLLKNIKLLRDTLNAIDKENSIAPDNADLNFAKGKMLLIYDQATTDQFFELLLNTQIFTSPLTTTEEGLPDKLTVDAKLGFNPFAKTITYAGIMTNNAKTQLENAADSLILADVDTLNTQPELDVFINLFKAAVNQVFIQGNTALTDFGTLYPELKTIYDAVIAQPEPAGQIKTLLDSLMPELKSKLKVNGLRQALIGILKADPEIVQVLTSRKEIMKSLALAGEQILFDFSALENNILFNANQAYSFYLAVPATDDYLIYLGAPQNTKVTLKINGADVIPNTTISADEEVKNASALKLNTGVLHLAELTVQSLPAGKQVQISWRTKGMEKSIIPPANTYDSDKVETASKSLIRLQKAVMLQSLLKFTPEELDHFGSTNSETQNFLNLLDAEGTISAGDLSSLWNILNLFMQFNLIKKENEPEENTWLQILKNPDIKNSQNKLLLEYFNMWKEADLTEVLSHLGKARADLSKLSVLRLIVEAMTTLRSIPFAAVDVLTWVNADPAYTLIDGIKTLVKQSVTEASWLESMQTVNDPVRNLLRDALVSYILQYQKPSAEITNADKLYEYFLIDVEMDACMKTSRIRLALSTVQLFIQRCLMNLEPDVDPESIRADHWAWMKRYRVWEANRKVFLYPENWLEPELRDNKSYLFKELEGELLQSEITDESAELAFLNYLKKLDDIAKLQIVGYYLQENQKGNQFDDILHVFGRTMGTTRQYYYRRYEYGYWTPWEKVTLNIEGEHVFPVIWRKRLFLFWLSIFEKPLEGNRNKNPQDLGDDAWGESAKRNVEVTMCWGEYYKGKWTSPKSTESNNPMVIQNLSYFSKHDLLVYGRIDVIEHPAGKFRERLIFNLRYRGGGGGSQRDAVFMFTSKNAPPYLSYTNDPIIMDKLKKGLDILFFNPYSGTEATIRYNTRLFMPGRIFKVNVEQPAFFTKPEITETILTKKDQLFPGFAITPLRHPTENQFEAPVAYSDERSNFFVQPDERTFTPLRIYEGYYPLYEIPVKYKEIPELVREPIPGWPPEEVFHFGEEVILENPWKWNEEGIRLNTNYTKVLPVIDTFTVDNNKFNVGNLSEENIGHQ